MDTLALMCFVLGAVAIAVRGPLIIWPEAVLNLFRRIIEHDFRLRLMGLALAGIGAGLAAAAYGEPTIAAKALLWLGVFLAAISILLLVIFPKTYRAIAIFYMEMDSSVHRFTGVLGVIYGAFMIWLGIYLS